MSRKLCITLVTVLSLLLTASLGYTSDVFTVSGKVLKADGTLAVGYDVKVTNETRTMTLDEGIKTTATTDAAGEYLLALTGDAVVEVGDTFRVDVLSPGTGDILGHGTGGVTDANFDLNAFGLKIGSIIINVNLPGITAQVVPVELKAGVDTQATISVTVLDQSGNPVTDDTVTLEIVEGAGEWLRQLSLRAAYITPTTRPQHPLPREQSR
jgi:hypothetical protein